MLENVLKLVDYPRDIEKIVKSSDVRGLRLWKSVVTEFEIAL